MSKTRIDWADYSINPVKGLCPMDCKNREGKSYCYARRMYKRFHWDETIRFDWSIYNDICKIKKPSRIFWGSTMELFGEWVDPEWMRLIFEAVKHFSQHTHIFLTKKPLNVIKFMGGNPEYHHFKPARKFPNNVWLGVSVTSKNDAAIARDLLNERMAKVNFLSIEPLKGKMDGWALGNVIRLADWIIIGQETPVSEKAKPNVEWIADICKEADKFSKPIFLKNNLRGIIPEEVPLFNKNQYELRQEFPNK